MAFLDIAGSIYDVAQGGAGQRYDMQVGSSTHSFNGGLRSAKRTTKWAWPMVLSPMTQSQFNNLLSDIANGAHVTCAGDVLQGYVVCEVVLNDVAFLPDMSDALGFKRQPSLTLIEV